MTCLLFDIVRNSFVDGPGIRTTVFFKGCNLHCAWCHNPESQSRKPQMLFYAEKCNDCGKCRAVCPTPNNCTLCGKCTFYCPADARKICGKEYTPEEVLEEVVKDKPFYKNSGGGVTFSGGECMLQIDALEALLKLCKEAGIHTAVDTAGDVPFKYFERILPYTDLFLYDIKSMDDATHRKYTGASNKRILDNLRQLLKHGCKLWIRIPVIPGVNDTGKEMEKIRDFLANFPTPERIELLPYHALGEHKYAALGKEAQTFSVPTEARLEQLRKILHS